MTRYRIASVIRWDKQDPILASCQDFIARLSRYRNTELIVVKPSNTDEESSRITTCWGGRSQGPLVVLDESGRALSTRELRLILERWELEGSGKITLAVGGAYGTTKQLQQSADLVWSLSPLTLPHRLALLIACEQLYRVQTMLRNEPYHHG